MSRLILASRSPRRKELLEQIQLSFIVIPSTMEEVITGQKPEDVVLELSRQKAYDVFTKQTDPVKTALQSERMLPFIP